MLELTDLRKTFNPGTPNAVTALEGVSFRLPAESFVTVIGTNGSGKSTLLNAIAGVFFCDGGRIVIREHDVTRWPEHRRARLVGRVFQDPFMGTAPGMTIAENLALATRRGRPRGLSPALPRGLRHAFRDRVATLGMGLEDRLDNPIGTLSGGQRQALTLLIATWLKPDLLLLDEHTAALDPKSAEQIVRLTRDLVAADRLTTLMVTHSMAQAASLGDRLIMMHRGRIVHELAGAEKRRVQPEDLLHRFDELRRDDQLDESAAELLRKHYV